MIPFGESPNTDKLKFRSRSQSFEHKVENAVLGGDIEITSNSNSRCSSSRVFFAHLDLELSSREEFSDVFKKLASPIVSVCFQSVLEGYLDFITAKNALSSLGFPKSGGGGSPERLGQGKNTKYPWRIAQNPQHPKN